MAMEQKNEQLESASKPTREEELAFLRLEMERRQKEKEKKEQVAFDAFLRKKEEQTRTQVLSSYHAQKSDIEAQARRDAKNRRRSQAIKGVGLLSLVGTLVLFGFFYKQGSDRLDLSKKQYQTERSKIQEDFQKQFHIAETEKDRLISREQELQHQLESAKRENRELTSAVNMLVSLPENKK